MNRTNYFRPVRPTTVYKKRNDESNRNLEELVLDIKMSDPTSMILESERIAREIEIRNYQSGGSGPRCNSKEIFRILVRIRNRELENMEVGRKSSIRGIENELRELRGQVEEFSFEDHKHKDFIERKMTRLEQLLHYLKHNSRTSELKQSL